MPEPTPTAIREWRDVTPELFHEQILPLNQPAVLRGLVREWPAVKAAGESARAASDYLARFDQGMPVEVTLGPPGINGRFFYNDTLTGYNFERRKQPLGETLRALLAAQEQTAPPAIYVSALPVSDNVPGFAGENPMPLLPPSVGARVWLGNRITVQTHYDLTGNVACVVAGRRRFTLFPPAQLANLYVGPLEFTLAGTPVSLVQLHAPDFERFPRFREALAQAQTAELEPGDGIYVPYLWWHHVEALATFNVLVNYWWADTPRWMGSPFEALVHSVLAVRGLSADKREAWREFFEHFVFREPQDSADHLPEGQRGIQSPPTAQGSAMMRSYLLERLAREQRLQEPPPGAPGARR